MSKVISFEEGKRKQAEGIKKAVDIMRITIGPKGKNVSLTNGDIVNDGKQIAEDVVLKDPTEQKGAESVKRLVRKISKDVGGGRTACAILYNAIIQNGLNYLEKGFNFNVLKEGMLLAVKDIHEQLDKMSKPAKGKLKQVATISTESEELGKVIAEVMEKVGKDGVVTAEESQSFGITSDIAEGLKFDKGFLSPYMVTDRERQEAEYKDIPVLILEEKLTNFADIQPLLDSLVKKNKKELLIIAPDVDEPVLRILAFAKFNGLFKFNVLAIKTPGIGDMQKYCVEDLCALVNTEPIQDLKKSIKIGLAKKVTATRDSTVIIGTGDIKTWITTLKTRKELSANPWEKDQFTERIAKLQNGVAVIKVGSSSEKEVKYLKLKIEDGVNETKRALEEGIVMGGNCAFIHATKPFIDDKRKFDDENQKLGYKIVVNSCVAPLKQIVENSANSSDVVLDRIANSESLTTGYNALDNKVVDDMYSLGIIDAVKVVKTTLKYAVDEAILFLSLGGDISEELKDEANK